MGQKRVATAIWCLAFGFSLVGWTATAGAEDCLPGSLASLLVEGAPYSAGQTVVVRYEGGPGNQYDSIELYRQHSDGSFENMGGPWVWGETSGEMERELPAPGVYEFRFVLDNLQQATVNIPDGLLACHRIEVAAASNTSPDTALGQLPVGTYEPYFWGFDGQMNYWLAGDIEIGSDNAYAFQGEMGVYGLDAATGRIVFTGGNLDGAYARLEESDGKPAIVLPREENLQIGNDLKIVSDIWAYLRE